ncbi:MAG: alpha/beta hydrolase [Candidatus Micrarchaeota archaeon]|nr:alpha/beta hydrolase [Candidatus Micrarchaeota archaeon]
MDYDKDFESAMVQTRHGRINTMHHKGSSGFPMIFIHGFGASTRTFKRLMPYLDSKLDIYLIDLLGHGMSEDPEISYSVQTQLDVLSDFISQLKLPSPVLFGHSYGGWIATLHTLNTGNVKGLILEDSAGLEEFSKEMHEEGPKYKAEMLRQATMLNGRAHVIKSALEADDNDHHIDEHDLDRIKVPTQIIWGSADDITAVKYARIFGDHIEGSRLKIMEGVGHTPHFTNAEEVAYAIMYFLGDL